MSTYHLRPIPLREEVLPGDGASGVLYHGDALELLPTLGIRPDLIYVDPPYATGKDFGAYTDKWASFDAYLAFLKALLAQLCGVLAENGNLFVHVDYRASAYARVMLDELLGRGAFRNEIIWSYNSGGRSTKHFSYKHDTILYYAHSKHSFFDGLAVAPSRGETVHNHMKRGVDEEGRTYSSIRSGGKEYRYYDDAKAPLSDVWTDISHLQQKDPERTGYPTQKPLALLKRIIGCASREGELVLDACAGSGTTLLAASKLGRRYVGIDRGEEAIAAIRERMQGRALTIRSSQQSLQHGITGQLRMDTGRLNLLTEPTCTLLSLGHYADGSYTQLAWVKNQSMTAFPEGCNACLLQIPSGTVCCLLEGE